MAAKPQEKIGPHAFTADQIADYKAVFDDADEVRSKTAARCSCYRCDICAHLVHEMTHVRRIAFGAGWFGVYRNG